MPRIELFLAAPKLARHAAREKEKCLTRRPAHNGALPVSGDKGADVALVDRKLLAGEAFVVRRRRGRPDSWFPAAFLDGGRFALHQRFLDCLRLPLLLLWLVPGRLPGLARCGFLRLTGPRTRSVKRR